MTQSHDLFQNAKNHIPGGVNSPVRAFHGVGGDPIFFKQGDAFEVLHQITGCKKRVTWGQFLTQPPLCQQPGLHTCIISSVLLTFHRRAGGDKFCRPWFWLVGFGQMYTGGKADKNAENEYYKTHE